MRKKPRFKPGDWVKFSPGPLRPYTHLEQRFIGDVGVILDYSDLPNVKMSHTFVINGYTVSDMITADQNDLVPI